MMTRRLLSFMLGLCLGSWCALAFSAPTAAGSRIDMSLRPSAPSGVTLGGVWDAVVPGLEDVGYGGYRASDFGAGSGEIYRGVATRVDGVPVALEARRGITAANLGRAARGFVMRGGPVGIIRGVLVAEGLNWVAGQWMIDRPPEGSPTVVQPGGDYYTLDNACSRLTVGQSGVNLASNGTYAIWVVSYSDLSGQGYIQRNSCVNRPPGPSGQFARLWAKSVSSPYQHQLQSFPATPEEIEGLLTDNLVDGDLSPEDALREIIQNGTAEDGATLDGLMGDVQGSGPVSVPGATITSTTSGPSGQTTSTTSSQYGIGYGPNGAVTITKNDTVTTTTPDGQTETRTVVTSPSPAGQNNKPEEQKTDCDKYPDASGCEKLGNPAQDINLQTRDLDISSLNYQSVSGSCPGPKAITTSLGSYELSYEPICTAADFLRPVIVLSGLLTAGIFVFMGARRAS